MRELADIGIYSSKVVKRFLKMLHRAVCDNLFTSNEMTLIVNNELMQ